MVNMRSIEIYHLARKANRGIRNFALAFSKEEEHEGKIVRTIIQTDIVKMKGKNVLLWQYGKEGFSKPMTKRAFVKKTMKKLLKLEADYVNLFYEQKES